MSTDSAGYCRTTINKTQRRLHQIVGEAALGRPLPNGSHVHHVNGDRSDNRGRNLVICQSAAYHQELHRKMRVRARGGNPWTEHWCTKCLRMKPLEEFYRRRASGHLVSGCKPCAVGLSRRWQDSNQEKYSEMVSAYRARKLALQRARRRREADSRLRDELAASDVLGRALVAMLDKIEGGTR